MSKKQSNAGAQRLTDQYNADLDRRAIVTKTKITRTELAARLQLEGLRYTELAKIHALRELVNNGNGSNAKLAREHLIRAETYQTAATLILNS